MKKELAGIILFFLLVLSCGGNEDNLFSGTIEITNVRISSRVSGAIEELSVEQGDLIQTGVTLVQIDPTEYQLALTQAEAALTIAEANLETMMEGSREQQIVAASSFVTSTRAARNQAVTDLQRAEELALAGAISEQQLQMAETYAAQARTAYTSAEQNYSLSLEGARATELEAAQAAVEAAEAAKELAQNRVEWAEITSPLTGTVTGTNIETGENISAGSTLLTVADMDTVKAIFYISQPYLATTEIGSSVTVSTNTAEDSWGIEGRITHISDSAEFTPSQVETREGRTSLVYRIEAEIPNPESILKAGMPVDVYITQVN